jgi:hypothetical protein
MPAVVTVNSERAEQSELRVNRALAHFWAQAQGAQARRLSGRVKRGRVGGVWSAASFQSHDAILRLVAIAEDFSIGHFVDIVEPLLPSDPVVATLWDAELDRSGDTWHQRNALWKRYKNVIYSAFPQSDPLDGFIEARNSIAHGLGGLTRKQQRKWDSTTGKLRHASIRVEGESLVLDATHVEQCAIVVKAYIGWLDAKS